MAWLSTLETDSLTSWPGVVLLLRLLTALEGTVARQMSRLAASKATALYAAAVRSAAEISSPAATSESPATASAKAAATAPT